MKVSIVMPVYNEAATIREIVRRVLSQPGASGNGAGAEWEKELIIVNDGSTDGTPGLLKEIAQSHPEVKILHHGRNRGKGAALRTGFPHATGELVVIQDADLEYDPREYPKLLEPLWDGRADVVYGSRFLGGPHRVFFFWHYVGNRILTLLCNAVSNLNLTDMETGYKAFRREVLGQITVRSNRFAFEPEFTVKVAKKGFRIYEVSISYSGRQYSEGKKANWRDGAVALFAILWYGASPPAVTRGSGLFERFLAEQRCRLANRLIPDVLRKGRLLDIGCGSFPLFLRDSPFAEKVGLDKGVPAEGGTEELPFPLVRHDIEGEEPLPFESESFHVVTLLAVVEHLDPRKVVRIFGEIRRILRAEGMLVMTTPAPWTDGLLRWMARQRLVSPEEIEEHKGRYGPSQLARLLEEARFPMERIRCGYFECRMNVWATAGRS